MKKTEKIGEILLETGVLLIGDIVNLSKLNKEKITKKASLRHKSTNKIYEYPKDFTKYTDVLFDNKTVNQLIELDILEEINQSNETELSISNIVNSIEDKGYKQLKFETGITGKALAFLNTNGEKFYPVYVETTDNKINKLTIDFT